MPPKKDKKKPKPKAKGKRIRMAAAPPQFATGFNRQIPGGIIGTGGGGGMNAPGLTAASFLGASLAKQVTQATPVQTPDQFNIIQEQRKQKRELNDIQDIIDEQKRAARNKSMRDVIKDLPDIDIPSNLLPTRQTPLSSMTMTEQLREETTPMRMAPPIEAPPETPDARIGKVGKPKKVKIKESTEMAQPEFGSPPPVIGSAEFPGGANINQQGMFMGAASSIRGAPPDGSTSLTGLNPIGDFDGVLE